MRITFVLPGIGISGGSRVVFEYANRLISRGHHVSIVYPLLPIAIRYKPTWGELRKNLGALKAVFRGKNVGWFDLKANIIRVPVLEPWAAPLVEPLIPASDVIVATAWETAHFVNALKRQKGKKFYFIQHYEVWDLWDDEACWAAAERLEPDPNLVPSKMAYVEPKAPPLNAYKRLVDQTYSFPLRKIVVSSWLKDILEAKSVGRIEGPVLNAVNRDVFYEEGRDEAGHRLCIVMPYRPYKNKGTADGIAALDAVRQKHPDIELVLFGSRRHSTPPSWAEFYEDPTDDALRRLYCSADIFVSPSWVDGFCLPPMEACACGCAVVATKVGAVPDYGVDGSTMLMPPPRRPGLLAENILKLVENDGLRRTIAAAGREYIGRFTWDESTDRLEKIFSSSIGQ